MPSSGGSVSDNAVSGNNIYLASIKPDVAIQGGGPNYLGEQPIAVDAPINWQSSPDHKPAHLAYITDAEQDLLVNKDMYDSLDGKPNRGPSGIPSLQGDMGSWDGGDDAEHDMSGVGENGGSDDGGGVPDYESGPPDNSSGDGGGVPDYESGSPQNTWDTMSDEQAKRSKELTKAQHEAVLGDHGDPMGNPEEQAKYARYVKYTAGNQAKTDDLTFKEHWDNAPGILKYSLVLRGLYAAGKNLAEWARSKGWNWNSTTGKVTDNDGNEVSESDMQGATASQAPYMVSGTTPVNSMATQWYSTLGSSPSNPGAFDLTAQYAKAKAAVSQRLGNPTSVGQLAVNNSPFYNWLKDNSLNKGIL